MLLRLRLRLRSPAARGACAGATTRRVARRGGGASRGVEVGAERGGGEQRRSGKAIEDVVALCGLAQAHQRRRLGRRLAALL